MAKNKGGGLGRGLDSIFLDNTESGEKRELLLKVSKIEPEKNQPRKRFDEEALVALADSIKEHGVIQPIAVRESDNGYYKIIAGERRWRASKLAGLTEIPAIIISADDRKAAELSMIENLQREDLDPIEEAEGYILLSDKFGMTQEQLAVAVGKSRSAVANTMRLVDLPDEIKDLVIGKKLTEGHARALLGVKNKNKAIELANRAAEKKLSVRQTELSVKRLNAEKKTDKDSGSLVDYAGELADRMTKKLGRRVQIKQQGNSGTLSISFEDNDDLTDLAVKICGKSIIDD